MEVKRALETGIKSIRKWGNERKWGKYLFLKQGIFLPFGYTFYAHLWAPEWGKL